MRWESLHEGNRKGVVQSSDGWIEEWSLDVA